MTNHAKRITVAALALVVLFSFGLASLQVAPTTTAYAEGEASVAQKAGEIVTDAIDTLFGDDSGAVKHPPKTKSTR